MTKLKTIMAAMHRQFPPACAESWDNVGLLLGRSNRDIRRVLVCLELTPQIAREALEVGADLVLTHHPFIFKPLNSLTDQTPDGQILLDLAEAGVALFAAHTNLDAVFGGIATRLATDLGLSNLTPLIQHRPYLGYKIVTFVPGSAIDAVAHAMHQAGAGAIGEYSECSFRLAGEGRFRCGEDTNPAIGSPGSQETVEEVRIEMVVSQRDLARVCQALLEAHPYEEPAYDVFELKNAVHGIDDVYGFGVVGELSSTSLADLAEIIKAAWGIDSLRVAGAGDKVIRRVAILNGSGAKFLSKAMAAGADVYITGDCGHHDFDLAQRHGIALIDAGHYHTEKGIVDILIDALKQCDESQTLDIRRAQSMHCPFRVF
ncbi:MAG: Nif3-like dinuclear metal center hexameric protein [Proteobacteria bacterium]|nr:Nif3-like dinuclear metal center hexameric protein [Pseudomonadota bacterium]